MQLPCEPRHQPPRFGAAAAAAPRQAAPEPPRGAAAAGGTAAGRVARAQEVARQIGCWHRLKKGV